MMETSQPTEESQGQNHLATETDQEQEHPQHGKCQGEDQRVPEAWRVSDYSLTFRSWPLLTEANPANDLRGLRGVSLVGKDLHRDAAAGLIGKSAKQHDGVARWAGVQSHYFMAIVATLGAEGRSAIAAGENRTLTEEQIAHLDPARDVREPLSQFRVSHRVDPSRQGRESQDLDAVDATACSPTIDRAFVSAQHTFEKVTLQGRRDRSRVTIFGIIRGFDDIGAFTRAAIWSADPIVDVLAEHLEDALDRQSVRGRGAEARHAMYADDRARFHFDVVMALREACGVIGFHAVMKDPPALPLIPGVSKGILRGRSPCAPAEPADHRRHGDDDDGGKAK
jgi:hypothetical protein